MTKEMDLLQELRADVEDLSFKDEDKRDACLRRTEMLSRRIFGEGSRYMGDLKYISFHPKAYLGGMTDEDYPGTVARLSF